MAFRLRFAVLLLLVALPGVSEAGALFREPGAVYLEDVLQKPIKLAVVANAPIYFDSNFGRYLGDLKKGDFVELQAVSDAAYRVVGQARQGQVVGWVEPKYLDELKPDFLANIKKASDRQAEVKALIARKEAAINMTPTEVTESLGKASTTSSRLDATGRHEVWEYIRYELMPQPTTFSDRFGNVVQGVTYVKVPAGKLSVIFDNNLVTAIEQTEGNLAKDAQVRIVSTPIEAY
jgi:hypothetical protein